MINFLNSKLSPKVNCMSPAMENYEVNNLVHEDPVVRSRGFLAYTSIKPPVDVEFELICPVTIAYISIFAAVGSQRSNGVEILARSNNSDYVSIARAFFDEPLLIVCNSRMFSRNEPPPGVNENAHISFLKSNTFRIFLNASKIKIRILRTERSVPCLGKVEIWGKVSKMCSAITAKTVTQLAYRSQSSTKKDRSESKEATSDTQELDFEIPEEFKDALTYEVMSLPMTLPSGSTVDKSTLEKFIENEAVMGRHPCDPFTGLKFTDERKPTLNVALKSRIDMFLTKHSDKSEVTSVARTVGTKKNLQASISNRKRVSETERTISKHLKTSSYNSDLDDVISRTMKDTNFIKFTEECDTEVNKQKKCNICENSCALYILPCEHLHCRSCLLTQTDSEMYCKKCKKICKKNEIQAFHIT